MTCISETWNASLISQGAEAKIYTVDFFGVPAILKERVKKSYRLPELDVKINSSRLLSEVRMMRQCFKANISAPAIYHIDVEKGFLIMEQIKGVTIKEFLKKVESSPELLNSTSVDTIMKDIGSLLAKMHSLSITHGDLTTSNLLLRNYEDAPESWQVVLIDFGLSASNFDPESKAVDLYVLERAFQATHSQIDHLFETILDSYLENAGKASKAVMNKLAEVRLRGRKRSQLG